MLFLPLAFVRTIDKQPYYIWPTIFTKILPENLPVSSGIEALNQIQATCSPAPFTKCAAQSTAYEHEQGLILIVKPLLLSLISLIGLIIIAFQTRQKDTTSSPQTQKTFHSLHLSQIETVQPVLFHSPQHLTSTWDMINENKENIEDEITLNSSKTNSQTLIGNSIQFFSPVSFSNEITLKPQNSFFNYDSWY